MHSIPDRVRKAAILVASLDAETAAAVFASLSDEEARQLRDAVDDLVEIAGGEQAAVLAEFLSAGGNGSEMIGVELDDALAQRIAAFEPPSPEQCDAESVATAQPFRDFATMDGAELVECLQAEHPQTVAVVLAHLPPTQAADVLRRWDIASRTELLDRMAALTPTPPDLLREIAHELLARWRAHAEQRASARRNEAQVAAILAAADEPVRLAWQQRQAQATNVGDALLENIDEADSAAHSPFRDDVFEEDVAFTSDGAELPLGGVHVSTAGASVAASSSTAPQWSWDDLAQFDDESLATLFAAAPAEIVRLALAGAEEGLLHRMRRHLGPRAARLLDQQLQRLDAVRLSDIAEAQRRLAALAGKLVQDGVLFAL